MTIKETKTKANPETTLKKQPEAAYSKQEIIAAAARFNVSRDTVVGALRSVGKEQLTFSEAEKAIQDFKKREV